MRAGLRLSVAAAPRGVTGARMPAGTGVALLADVPDGERGDAFPQPVIRREHSVIPMPVLPRRRDEIGGFGRRVGAGVSKNGTGFETEPASGGSGPGLVVRIT